MDYLWTPWRIATSPTPRKTTAAFSATQSPQTTTRNALIVLRGKKNYVILNRFPYTAGMSWSCRTRI